MINRALESRWLFALNVVVLVFGACSFLLTTAVDEVRVLRVDTCPWRVSGAGVVHGPDSQYREMVPPSRCYATEAEAREAAGN